MPSTRRPHIDDTPTIYLQYHDTNTHRSRSATCRIRIRQHDIPIRLRWYPERTPTTYRLLLYDTPSIYPPRNKHTPIKFRHMSDPDPTTRTHTEHLLARYRRHPTTYRPVFVCALGSPCWPSGRLYTEHRQELHGAGRWSGCCWVWWEVHRCCQQDISWCVPHRKGASSFGPRSLAGHVPPLPWVRSRVG